MSVVEVVEIIRSCPAFTTVKDVIYWRDIKTSGIIWAFTNLIFFVLLVSKYSILTFSALALLVGLFCGEVSVLFSLYRNQANPFIGVTCRNYAPPETTRAILQTINQLKSLICTYIYTVMLTTDADFFFSDSDQVNRNNYCWTLV
eukprot:TRINITY_DN328_c0_g1_i5.p1 TRINITY_DN328_c0_g1~~TRINITY_DN328_c0_g1_i5.p1  ORF type:complete len:145 (-),score=10.44 TRINITY_DN328_c0_g1_i5:325-759(-)